MTGYASDGAQRDQHLLVYLDEAHIHQDCDLGYGWAACGQRLWVNSGLPGLSVRVSFYGLDLYNEGHLHCPRRGLERSHRRPGPHPNSSKRRLRKFAPTPASFRVPAQVLFHERNTLGAVQYQDLNPLSLQKRTSSRQRVSLTLSDNHPL